MGAKSKIITTSKNSKREAIFLIDHLRHLFSNPKDSELMRWRAMDERKKDNGVVNHPFDTQQWKDLDTKYQEFHEDLRNVRFTLSTNGMNPFGSRTKTHRTWPVILLIYILPPWLCQKRKYLLLTIIISEPKAPGIDIDVFIEPLMQGMATLWSMEWKCGMSLFRVPSHVNHYFSYRHVLIANVILL